MQYDFCEFRCSTEGKPAALFFYGDIVSDSWSAWTDEDQYPAGVRDLLDEIGDGDLDIHINSGGGDVFAGVAICNMLRSRSGKKTVYVDGLAASIASVIAMAGDEIVMPENAFLMIHNASTFTWGTAADLRETADLLDRLNESIAATYMTRAADGVTREDFRARMDAETWLGAAEAAALFSNIRIRPGIQAAAALDSRYAAHWRNAPELAARHGCPPQPDSQKPADLEPLKRYAAALRAARL